MILYGGGYLLFSNANSGHPSSCPNRLLSAGGTSAKSYTQNPSLEEKCKCRHAISGLCKLMQLVFLRTVSWVEGSSASMAFLLLALTLSYIQVIPPTILILPIPCPIKGGFYFFRVIYYFLNYEFLTFSVCCLLLY